MKQLIDAVTAEATSDPFQVHELFEDIRGRVFPATPGWSVLADTDDPGALVVLDIAPEQAGPWQRLASLSSDPTAHHERAGGTAWFRVRVIRTDGSSGDPVSVWAG